VINNKLIIYYFINLVQWLYNRVRTWNAVTLTYCEQVDAALA